MARILEEAPNPLPAAVIAAWPGLPAVISRCLMKDPSARYDTMSDVVDALQRADQPPVSFGVARDCTPSAPRPSSPPKAADSWWWQCHQVVVSVLYVAMIYPTWKLRGMPLPSSAHNLLVLAVIVAAALATTLRLHRVFIARVQPDQLIATERRSRRWTHRSDALMILSLLCAAGAALVRDQLWFAALFATAGCERHRGVVVHRAGDRRGDIWQGGPMSDARPSPDDMARLLDEASAGKREALEALLPFVYDELHRLAIAYMRRERPGQTLQATALVHEAYLRLLREKHTRWENRAHFCAIAAGSMRQILVERARARGRLKRAGDQHRITLSDAIAATTSCRCGRR